MEGCHRPFPPRRKTGSVPRRILIPGAAPPGVRWRTAGGKSGTGPVATPADLRFRGFAPPVGVAGNNAPGRSGRPARRAVGRITKRRPRAPSPEAKHEKNVRIPSPFSSSPAASPWPGGRRCTPGTRGRQVQDSTTQRRRKRDDRCDKNSCGGSGADKGTRPCSHCGGKGAVRISQGGHREARRATWAGGRCALRLHLKGRVRRFGPRMASFPGLDAGGHPDCSLVVNGRRAKTRVRM